MPDDKKPVEKPVEDSKPDFDPTAYKEEIRSEVDSKLEQTVAEATKEIEERATKRAKEEMVKSIVGETTEPKTAWEKENRNPKNYTEIAEEGARIAREQVDATLKEKEEAQKKAAEEAKKSEEQKFEEQNKRWTDQMTNLVEKGEIPAPSEEVQKKLDANQQLSEQDRLDPGMKARAEIFRKAKELKEGNLELVYYRDVKGGTGSQAGASAPVFGARRGGAQTSGEGEWTYEELHNARSYEELMEAGRS